MDTAWSTRVAASVLAAKYDRGVHGEVFCEGETIAGRCRARVHVRRSATGLFRPHFAKNPSSEHSPGCPELTTSAPAVLVARVAETTTTTAAVGMPLLVLDAAPNPDHGRGTRHNAQAGTHERAILARRATARGDHERAIEIGLAQLLRRLIRGTFDHETVHAVTPGGTVEYAVRRGDEKWSTFGARSHGIYWGLLEPRIESGAQRTVAGGGAIPADRSFLVFTGSPRRQAIMITDGVRTFLPPRALPQPGSQTYAIVLGRVDNPAWHRAPLADGAAGPAVRATHSSKVNLISTGGGHFTNDGRA